MRAFLAVELSEALREQIARVQQQLKHVLAGVHGARLTWVKPAAIHLTVKFLGDFEDRHVDGLREKTVAAIGGHAVLDIPLSRLGAFPKPQAPRTLWVGPPATWESTEPAGALGRLVRAIDATSAEFGVERERQVWRPHLTLARVRVGERQVGRALERSGITNQSLSLDALRVDALVLMQSDLRPDGPVHTPLWTIQLS